MKKRALTVLAALLLAATACIFAGCDLFVKKVDKPKNIAYSKTENILFWDEVADCSGYLVKVSGATADGKNEYETSTNSLSVVFTAGATYTITITAVSSNEKLQNNTSVASYDNVLNATVTLDGATVRYDGSAHGLTAVTSPAGLSVKYTYNLSETIPTAAGTYNVVATVDEKYYSGSATATLVIDDSADLTNFIITPKGTVSVSGASKTAYKALFDTSKAFSDATLVFPDRVLDGYVTEVGISGSNSTSVTAVRMGEHVTSCSFSGFTSLESITLSQNIVEIEANAFNGCTSLTSITIPASVQTIRDGAFKNCSSLASVSLGETTQIGDEAFKGCVALGEVNLCGVSAVGASAFSGCTLLSKVFYDENLTELGARAFENCSIDSIVLSGEVSDVGEYAFAGNTGIRITCAFTSLQTPAGWSLMWNGTGTGLAKYDVIYDSSAEPELPYAESGVKASFLAWTSVDQNIDNAEELLEYIEYFTFSTVSTEPSEKIYLNYVDSTQAASDAINAAFAKNTFPGNSGLQWQIGKETNNTIYAKLSLKENHSTDEGVTESETPTSVQYPALNAISYEGISYNYEVESVTNTYSVTTSNQLVYVLEHGYKPLPVANSKAANIYAKAYDVLGDILNENMSDKQKIMAIYDWLVLNVEYDNWCYNNVTTDWYKYDSYFAEGVFNRGVAVCDGISKSFSILANTVGIPTISASGNGHAWNKSFINGKWYVFDATHGGVVFSGSTPVREALTYKYAFTTDAARAADGYVDGEYAYLAAVTEYDYYGKHTYTYGATECDLLIDSLSELTDLIYYFGTNSTTVIDKAFDIKINFNAGNGINDELNEAFAAARLRGANIPSSYSLAITAYEGVGSVVIVIIK